MAGVNDRSTFFQTQYERRELLRDLRMGEEQLKCATNRLKYLPKMPNEDNLIYQIRVNNSYLYNVVELNIQKIASKPFVKPARIVTDNLKLKTMEFDFDNHYHSINQFARTWFEDALWDSQSHVFIDMPVGIKREDGTTILDINQRPTCVILNNDNILHARYEGKELSYLRFRDKICIENGFDDTEVIIVKEFKRIEDKVYYMSYTQNSSNGNFSQDFEDYQELPLSYIPLVSFYPMSTRVPFAPDLIFKSMANIQIRHFNTLSDKRNSEKIMMIPILVVSGVDSDVYTSIPLSSYTAMLLKDPASKVAFTETNGQAANVGNIALEQMVKEMESLGLDLMTRSGGGETATANVIDQANVNTNMSCMAVALKDALEKVIDICIDWLRTANIEDISDDYYVDLTTKFNIRVSADDINYLNNALATGVISREDYFLEGQTRGILNADLTFEKTQENAEKDLPFGFPEDQPSSTDIVL